MAVVETPKHLYCDTPPTKLRNRKEKFRTAKDNRFWSMMADFVFKKMLCVRFHSVMYKGVENLENRDKTKATIFYANHNNWWDGIVGYNVVRGIMRGRLRLMIEEMNRFPLFQYIGCFPINKKSAQASMRALQYSVDELCDNKKSLWIFPQGIIRPPMYRPIEFQTGLAYIAKNVVKKAGGINLIPVAVNYPFLREDKPEVLCEVGEPIVLTAADFDRKDFTQKLEKEFESLCDKQFLDITKGNIDGYEYLYKQKLKWYKKLEKRLKRIEINTNSGV